MFNVYSHKQIEDFKDLRFLENEEILNESDSL